MRILDGTLVEQLLDMESCIREVEKAFRARGEGRRASSAVAGLELDGGSLHAKLGALDLSRGYAAAKINANFPGNPSTRGLPTIQGIIVLFDASSGVPLACMDSAVITATRTAAASAVAAKYLALAHASSVAFIGCGTQARAHVSALYLVRRIQRIVAFDADRSVAERFVEETRASYSVSVSIARDLDEAALAGEIVVTSTPSRRAFLDVGSLNEGTFVAAVGADNEGKQEIAPALLRNATVVVDDLEQCSRIGDLHHALELRVMRKEDVRASLDQIVAGVKPGRLDEKEIIVFDSTGVAIEDVAAAAFVYERAEETNAGLVTRSPSGRR
jgi:alanine dehydrogenase